MFDYNNVGRMEDRAERSLVQVGHETQYSQSKCEVFQMDHAQQRGRGVHIQSNGTNGQSVLSCEKVRCFELCRENPRRERVGEFI